MPNNEFVGLQKYKDKNGNVNIMYPVTKGEAIMLSDDTIESLDIQGYDVEDALKAINNRAAQSDGSIKSLQIGNVTTAPAGSQAAASVSNNGSTSVLNLTIPKGDKGDKGDTGPQGPPGASGTTTNLAAASTNGLMSAADKSKLDGIAAGAQVNSVTGVKGNAESSYRTGSINLTPANIGAAASGHTHSEYAASGHTHNYAGSSSAGGSATSADKLAAARTINGVSFNGTSNIILPSGNRWWVGSNSANANGWYKFMSATLTGTINFNMTIQVMCTYSIPFSGQLYISIRGDNGNIKIQKLGWLTRSGTTAADCIGVAVNGTAIDFYVLQSAGQYSSLCFTVLSQAATLINQDITYTPISSTAKESTTPTFTQRSADLIPAREENFGKFLCSGVSTAYSTLTYTDLWTKFRTLWLVVTSSKWGCHTFTIVTDRWNRNTSSTTPIMELRGVGTLNKNVGFVLNVQKKSNNELLFFEAQASGADTYTASSLYAIN